MYRVGEQARTNEVVDPDVHRETQLCTDAVGAADEHGVFKPGRLEIEDAAKATDLNIGAWPGRRAHEGLDGFNECVTCVDRHAGLCVGQTFGFRRGECPVVIERCPDRSG